ncbi:MAG: tetratricopeptide repeat protein, partial [Coprococcus sp.]
MADVLNCKHCGGTIQVTGYCAQCGLKSEYVNKALNSSKYYYNIGLDKARVRDMSGAKEALKAALKYDKMNIDARNLLGLVYYETGEVVMALSHWVVSVNHFSGRNVAKRYIKEVRSTPHKLEATNNVARKYNQALELVKQGNKDLAFIQLRKVLSDNNKFVDGYLLLALLFIDEERYDKARKALKRVIKIDRTNPLAVRYFREMGHTDEEIMNFRDVPEENYDADLLFVDDENKGYVGTRNVDFDGEPIPVGRYKDINFYKYSIAYIIAGIIMGIAVTWFLIVPHRDKTADDESRNLKITFSQEIADKNVKIASLENDIENLNTDLTSANKSVEDLNSKVKAYEASAAQALSDEDRVRMQSGIKKYEDMAYDSAMEDFNRVLDKNPDSDIALYYKGMCYI